MLCRLHKGNPPGNTHLYCLLASTQTRVTFREYPQWSQVTIKSTSFTSCTFARGSGANWSNGRLLNTTTTKVGKLSLITVVYNKFEYVHLIFVIFASQIVISWIPFQPDLCQHWRSVWAEPTESTLLHSNARKQSHLFTKYSHIWSKTEKRNTREWPQKQIHKDTMSATQLCIARMVLWSRRS